VTPGLAAKDHLMLNSIQPNATSTGCGILSRLESQTERIPDEVAVVCEGGTLTYSALNRRANQLAYRLIDSGVGSDRIVGVSLPRSIDMVVALLAVLKAGGAYIWLDPAYPGERLKFMIDDAKPEVVITKNSLLGHLPSALGERSLCLDLQAQRISEASIENPAVEGSPDDLAYIIYTSGSTGRPKGTAMGRDVLANLLDWQLENWTHPAAARTLQFTSLNFDVSFQEIFSTLCAGGTLILTSEEMRRDPSALLRLIRDSAVERIFLPFVALQQLAKAFEAEQIIPSNLRDVITAGEQLQITRQIKMFFEKLDGCALHNQYGPAESHIIVTALTLRGEPGSWPLLPSIGRPIAKARIYILDE
jgi:non-ribosomal peptide synthetase component F